MSSCFLQPDRITGAANRIGPFGHHSGRTNFGETHVYNTASISGGTRGDDPYAWYQSLLMPKLLFNRIHLMRRDVGPPPDALYRRLNHDQCLCRNLIKVTATGHDRSGIFKEPGGKTSLILGFTRKTNCTCIVLIDESWL